MPKYPEHEHVYATVVDEEVDEASGAGTGKLTKEQRCRICGKAKE